MSRGRSAILTTALVAWGLGAGGCVVVVPTFGAPLVLSVGPRPTAAPIPSLASEAVAGARRQSSSGPSRQKLRVKDAEVDLFPLHVVTPAGIGQRHTEAAAPKAGQFDIEVAFQGRQPLAPGFTRFEVYAVSVLLKAFPEGVSKPFRAWATLNVPPDTLNLKLSDTATRLTGSVGGTLKGLATNTGETTTFAYEFDLPYTQ